VEAEVQPIWVGVWMRACDTIGGLPSGVVIFFFWRRGIAFLEFGTRHARFSRRRHCANPAGIKERRIFEEA